MNPWLVAAIALLLFLLPCGILCLRGSLVDRLVGLQMAGLVVIILLMVLAEGFNRPSFFDLPLALSLLLLSGALAFVRFLERWI